MKRRTISISDEIDHALEREARRRAVPVSEITRRAIQQYLGIEPGKPRQLPFAALGRSSRGIPARDMEDFLAQGPATVQRLRGAVRDGQPLDLRVNA